MRFCMVRVRETGEWDWKSFRTMLIVLELAQNHVLRARDFW